MVVEIEGGVLVGLGSHFFVLKVMSYKCPCSSCQRRDREFLWACRFNGLSVDIAEVSFLPPDVCILGKATFSTGPRVG